MQLWNSCSNHKFLKLTLLDAEKEYATIDLEGLSFELPFSEHHSSNKPTIGWIKQYKSGPSMAQKLATR